MRFTRWLNPMLPQTLQIAVMLFYINAVFGVLFGTAFSLIGLAIVLGDGLAGLGIANSFKWGYQLGVLMSFIGLLPFVLVAVADGVGALFSLTMIINLVFPIALVALLLHPMSRDYQRIWFE